jgi:hypothetical protein
MAFRSASVRNEGGDFDHAPLAPQLVHDFGRG